MNLHHKRLFRKIEYSPHTRKMSKSAFGKGLLPINVSPVLANPRNNDPARVRDGTLAGHANPFVLNQLAELLPAEDQDPVPP